MLIVLEFNLAVREEFSASALSSIMSRNRDNWVPRCPRPGSNHVFCLCISSSYTCWMDSPPRRGSANDIRRSHSKERVFEPVQWNMPSYAGVVLAKRVTNGVGR